MNERSNKENLEIAFNFAEKELGITRLIDPEGKLFCSRSLRKNLKVVIEKIKDIDTDAPDEKSILTYVSLLYKAMPTVPTYPQKIKSQIVRIFPIFNKHSLVKN